MEIIALHNADQTVFPNLALMKLSAWHHKRGDRVVMYDPLFASQYSRVYSSKVFSFTPLNNELYGDVRRGGTGYDVYTCLPDNVEHECPDYQIFKTSFSLGFVTRGCSRSCSWCVVPLKEGHIREHADIDEFLRHDSLVLMDNNILAHEHGLSQIEKIGRAGVKVDFNQGLDARLIDMQTARRLSRLKWIRFTRLSCDTLEQIPVIRRAITLLRWCNVNPAQIFVYCLIRDVEEALERIRELKGLYVTVFAQPFRRIDGHDEPTQEQKDLARWVNHTAIFKSVDWENYRPRQS